MVAYTLRQLSYFVAAAEHQSLLKAALQMHVSPPSVSTAIAKLELHFGVQLLIRHHAQGVSLTSVTLYPPFPILFFSASVSVCVPFAPSSS